MPRNSRVCTGRPPAYLPLPMANVRREHRTRRSDARRTSADADALTSIDILLTNSIKLSKTGYKPILERKSKYLIDLIAIHQSR